MVSAVLPALAQNTYQFNMKQDVPVTKELVLEGIQTNDELKIALKIEWKSSDDRLHLTFDRKSVNEDGAYLLLFPTLGQKKTIKEVVDCKLHKRSLYSKNKALKIKSAKMGYFLTSENLLIENKSNCYRSLANNNEEDFIFPVVNVENDFTILLNDLYIAKIQKKSLSKKDKKLLAKAKPITLQMIPEKKPVKAELCKMEDVVLPFIKEHHIHMKSLIEEMTDAKKNQNCIIFGLFMDKIRRTFVEVNDRCEKFLDCESIMLALKNYNYDVEIAMTQECKAAPQKSASCSITESELTAVNNMLRNLQMKINVKKKNGENTAEENKDFQAIKNTVNPRLTADCRKAYKGQTDAYTSYCNVIQGLLK